MNSEGDRMAVIQNEKGSYMEQFGNITEMLKPTLTALRKAHETNARQNPSNIKSLPILTSHSIAIGSKHYDKSGQENRARHIHDLAKDEDSNQMRYEDGQSSSKL